MLTAFIGSVGCTGNRPKPASGHRCHTTVPSKWRKSCAAPPTFKCPAVAEVLGSMKGTWRPHTGRYGLRASSSLLKLSCNTRGYV
ncbi:MAG: hypothetical protein USCAAHI_01164 [Beijerinckiaceae bacterium]|nr:MAG: hypothetical protein USCAAHI_01164 [Beijerinckiaceae bacterium]